MKKKDIIQRGSEVNGLMGMQGFKWIKEDLEKEIELNTNDLVNGRFSSLIEVKEKQLMIQVYKKLLDRWKNWAEEATKLQVEG